MDDCVNMDRSYAKRLRHQQMKVRTGTENIENEGDVRLRTAKKKICFGDDNCGVPVSPLPSTPAVSDRFIPLRSSINSEKFLLLPVQKSPKTRKSPRSAVDKEDTDVYSSLLRYEIVPVNGEQDENKSPMLFRYTPPVRTEASSSISSRNIESLSPYTLSAVSPHSQALLRCNRRTPIKISRNPFKVLDAPELQDDFYLNLLDWSSQNVLSVGLASCVYLWSATTSQVTRLCDLGPENNTVTSVAWNEKGNLVAVGTQEGHVEIWDPSATKQVSKLSGHAARVGTLAWCGDVLASGSRDRSILLRDLRVPQTEFERRFSAHRQEVCGLKWSPDLQSLASGGNDNKLHIWNMHSSSPVNTFGDHVAAVKAIAWSPQHHGLLASGGGTADRTIRFWNTITGQAVQVVDTGSQVCNLAWSKHSSELVSSHGYSQNQIIVWKYPNMTQVAKLTGHSYRVLYLAVSPCGESIVTGAGDETLRFWKVFSKSSNNVRAPVSPLSLYQSIR
ncbi:WD domain, G-beta repeat [Nesidiocoris tenuis]|uniref:WD domain, G-beta repeat n=1 Tax=Nesidiocoris tenuis TaxID=355587 RepID=A0ABN7B3H0_9HEMI|nr:WD domain, G-beta repeat [Nesidiocoris tenuis]